MQLVMRMYGYIEFSILIYVYFPMKLFFLYFRIIGHVNVLVHYTRQRVPNTVL